MNLKFYKPREMSRIQILLRTFLIKRLTKFTLKQNHTQTVHYVLSATRWPSCDRSSVRFYLKVLLYTLINKRICIVSNEINSYNI